MTDAIRSLSARVRSGEIPASLQAIFDSPDIKKMFAALGRLTDSGPIADALKMNKAAAEAFAEFNSLSSSLRRIVDSTPRAPVMPPAPLQRAPGEMKELADIWFSASTFAANSLASSEGKEWAKSRYVDAFIRIADLAETLADRMLGGSKANDLLSNAPYDPEVRRTCVAVSRLVATEPT